ncbi:MAG: phosphonate C-P lyase system protein PhnH [Cyanophyceae cyanobacterium]
MTTLPGFHHLVHDSQTTFRALLKALSEPGTIQPISAAITPPAGLTPACAAACLTLLDLETSVWLQPRFEAEVQAWLLFHTGCRFTDERQGADFAVIQDTKEMPPLAAFNWGTAEQPENSTSLLIQVESFEQGQLVSLTGPGILKERSLQIATPVSFWEQWSENVQAYPLGVDCYFFTQAAVIALPRTTSATN